MPPIEQLPTGQPQSAGQLALVSPQSHLPLPQELTKLPVVQICPGVPGWQEPSGRQPPFDEQPLLGHAGQSAAQLVEVSPQLQVPSPHEADHVPFLQTMPLVPGWQVPCA